MTQPFDKGQVSRATKKKSNLRSFFFFDDRVRARVRMKHERVASARVHETSHHYPCHPSVPCNARYAYGAMYVHRGTADSAEWEWIYTQKRARTCWGISPDIRLAHLNGEYLSKRAEALSNCFGAAKTICVYYALYFELGSKGNAVAHYCLFFQSTISSENITYFGKVFLFYSLIRRKNIFVIGQIFSAYNKALHALFTL